MITDYFVKNKIFTVVPEVSDPTNRYYMVDDGGVEIEVGEFLYGLVRVLKPVNVLSTGIYSGISDLYISQAIKDNNIGRLTAVEYEKKHLERARLMWNQAGVDGVIESILCSSIEYTPLDKYQLMFLDTEPQIRFQEFERFYPFLQEGGYIFIHDLHRHLQQINIPGKEFAWPFGKLPDKMKELIKEGEVRVISFPTPRGLSGFYKPTKDDYESSIHSDTV